ncbi:MAG: chaperone modulator CbpM [Desulfobulbales bacterium]
MTKELIFLSGTILDEETEFGLFEICSMCNISAEMVHDMIDEGLISPKGSGPRHWRFNTCQVRRIQITLRLQRDLRINLPGCALVLDLLEELDELRRQRHYR